MSQNEKVHFKFIFQKTSFLFLVSLLCLSPAKVDAAKSCKKAFTEQTQFEKALTGEKIDNFDLLIEFENFWNRQEYRRPVQLVEIPFTEIKKDSLTIEYFGTEEENEQIAKLLVGDRGRKRWFHHPFNTASHVPHFYEGSSESIQGYLSSSRSIFFKLNGKYYSIRLPTNHPRGPKEKDDIAKTNIAPELEIASQQMHQIDKIDEIFNRPAQILFAKELAIIKTVDPKNSKGLLIEKSGYLVRNLNFLENKNRFYLPAFSLPEAGKMISDKMNKKFSDYWMQKYAEALGAVKAQLLIHYGLQMDFPHGQNILLELDEKMIPTGRFVLRDIDDMSQYTNVVQVLNEVLVSKGQEPLIINRRNAKGSVDLLWNRHSSRVISRSDDPEVYSEKIYADWERAHEQAYAKEVARLLGVKSKDIGKTANDVQATMSSAWGQGLLRSYFLNQ